MKNTLKENQKVQLADNSWVRTTSGDFLKESPVDRGRNISKVEAEQILFDIAENKVIEYVDFSSNSMLELSSPKSFNMDFDGNIIRFKDQGDFSFDTFKDFKFLKDSLGILTLTSRSEELKITFFNFK